DAIVRIEDYDVKDFERRINARPKVLIQWD
ncbi:MAG: hypothetical protein H6Q78_1308, partial [Candidatus Krumholzibacteriota bacterium]|nr:hypothetical protein [Candidatus Krumholzibacteriota bacterium]